MSYAAALAPGEKINWTDGAKAPRYVATTTALATLVAFDDDIAITQGYRARGDGGGNEFYFDAGSVLTPDGGFVIAGLGGNWIARDQTTADARQFGAYSDGTHATETKAAIQAAALKGGDVLIPAPGTYLVNGDTPTENRDSDVGGIKIPSNTRLCIEAGATVKQAPSSSPQYKIFRIGEVAQNVWLYGGGTIEGDRDEHTYAGGGSHEWGYGVFIGGGANNVSLVDLILKDCTGDGISIHDSNAAAALGTPEGRPRNIKLTRVRCTNNRRQGMSIIGVQGLLATDCIFENTNGTAPQTGVDIEPGGFGHEAHDMRFLNCSFQGNAARGLMAHGEAAVSDITGLLILGGSAVNNTFDGLATFRTHQDVRIQSVLCQDNGTAGIEIVTSEEVTVYDCRAISNSQTTHNTSDGIIIQNSARCVVTGNYIRKGDGANKQRYGIATLAATDCIIGPNDMEGGGETADSLEFGNVNTIIRQHGHHRTLILDGGASRPWSGYHLTGYSSVGVETGTVVIRTPYNLADKTYNLVIRGHRCDSSGHFEINLGFYAHASGFLFTSCQFEGSAPFPVRLAKHAASGDVCIFLGTTATAWEFVQLVVESVTVAGFSNPDESYFAGWSTSIVASEAAYDTVTTPRILQGQAAEIVVTNVAALSALVVSDGAAAKTKGYTTAGDGGGNDYYFVAGSSATVDGGFVLTGVGGRWFAMDQSRADIRKFGARGTGDIAHAAANASAINAANDAAAAIAAGCKLFVPTGRFYTNGGITYKVPIEGEGGRDAKSCIIGTWTNGTTPWLTVDTYQGSIKNLCIQGTSATAASIVGIKTSGSNANNYLLQDVMFNNCAQAVDWNGWIVTFRDCLATFNHKGLLLTNLNGCEIAGGNYEGNALEAIDIVSGTQWLISGATIEGNDANNTGVGEIKVRTSAVGYITNNYFESANASGKLIHVGVGASASADNLRLEISGNTFGGSGIGRVHLENCESCKFVDNYSSVRLDVGTKVKHLEVAGSGAGTTDTLPYSMTLDPACEPDTFLPRYVESMVPNQYLEGGIRGFETASNGGLTITQEASVLAAFPSAVRMTWTDTGAFNALLVKLPDDYATAINALPSGSHVPFGAWVYGPTGQSWDNTGPVVTCYLMVAVDGVDVASGTFSPVFVAGKYNWISSYYTRPASGTITNVRLIIGSRGTFSGNPSVGHYLAVTGLAAATGKQASRADLATGRAIPSPSSPAWGRNALGKIWFKSAVVPVDTDLTHQVGDEAVVSGVRYKCVVAGSPGTWVLGEPEIVASSVAALSARPAADGQSGRTTGYTTAGDGGGNDYYFVAGSSATIDGGFVIAGVGGRWFARDQSAVWWKKFGAKADGTDTVARAQAAIDAAVARLLPCYTGPGDFTIGSPLFLTGTASKTSAATFYSCRLLGAGKGIDAANANTSIIATFSDRPVTCVNMAREVEIADLAIVGTNLAPDTAKNTLDPVYANWVSVGQRNSRYSPQCAIAIDPTLGPTPPDGGYPGMTYIGNTASGSNYIRIRNVLFDKHVVATCIRPDGQVAQVDQIQWESCDFRGVACAIAPCNTQTRMASSVNEGECGYFHTFIDTLRYGAQSGCAPHVKGMQIGLGVRLIRHSSSFSPVNFEQCYSELLSEIGILGTGSAAAKHTATFVGCQFHFGFDDSRPPFIASAFMPTKFIGTSFVQEMPLGGFGPAPGGAAFNFQAGDGMSFDSCNFIHHAAEPPKFIAVVRDSGAIVEFKNCYKSSPAGNPKPVGFPIHGGYTRTSSSGTRLEPERSSNRMLITDLEGLHIYEPGSIFNHTGLAATSIALVGDTLTWTTADATIYQVGDYVLLECLQTDAVIPQDVPAAIITGISGSDITATVFVNLANVTAPAFIRTAIQEWAPAVALKGDTTSGSPTITAMTNNTVLKAGDWIKGTGLPANARVVSINTGASTVTLNKNATATGAAVDLYFGRLNSPTLTPTVL